MADTTVKRNFSKNKWKGVKTEKHNYCKLSNQHQQICFTMEGMVCIYVHDFGFYILYCAETCHRAKV